MYVKFFNPLGSVEDRLAIGIIEDAEPRYLSTVLFEGIAEGGDPEP
jgi:cysteine synthase